MQPRGEEAQAPLEIIEQPLRLFTDTRFKNVYLILDSNSMETRDGVFQQYQLARVELISVTDDDLSLAPDKLLSKYLGQRRGQDAWLFVGVLHEVEATKVPARAILRSNAMDILCINQQTGMWDLPPSEWFSFDLRAKTFELEQENLILKARDEERIRHLYRNDTQLKLLRSQIDNMEAIASTLQVLLGESRSEVLKFSGTAYQQMERNVQLNARVKAQEVMLQDYYRFRNEEFPKAVSGMATIVKDMAGLFKEWRGFLGRLDRMTKEDVELFRGEMETRLETIKNDIDTNLKTVITGTLDGLNKVKDKEAELLKGEEAPAVSGPT